MSSPRQRAVLNPVSTLGGECNVPSCVWPCGVPTRNVTNEDNPGSDPLDPGDHRPGPPVPPRYPRRIPARSTRSPRDGECPALPEKTHRGRLSGPRSNWGRLAAPPCGK